ncbi:UNVERIFIED_CONTAM: hypothetical protein Scaly_0077000 [Sesamum calycinum]|uniref:Peptidase A2 domain-containing protein n=1 Tax=Sesamum calycinum TaxID=2727403 RepID=A0AAW2SXH9_9LAMI
MAIKTAHVKISSNDRKNLEKPEDQRTTKDRHRLTLKELQEKEYPFLDSDVPYIFDELLERKLIELPESKRPEEVGKVNDPKYCKYHLVVKDNHWSPVVPHYPSQMKTYCLGPNRTTDPGLIQEQRVNLILVDGGSAINIIPKSTMKKLGMTSEDLSHTRLTIQGFDQGTQRAVGMTRLDFTMGELKVSTLFHVIDARTSYNLLLERSWLYENGVVPSTLHQCFKYIKNGEIVKVDANMKPFTETKSYSANAKLYLGPDNMQEILPSKVSIGHSLEEVHLKLHPFKTTMKNIMKQPRMKLLPVQNMRKANPGTHRGHLGSVCETSKDLFNNARRQRDFVFDHLGDGHTKQFKKQDRCNRTNKHKKSDIGETLHLSQPQGSKTSLLIISSRGPIKELIDSDNFYEESEAQIKNLKVALQEIKSLDISEESKLSLENVKRLIQRNFSENSLAWWNRNTIEATLKIFGKEMEAFEANSIMLRLRHLTKNLEKLDKKFRQASPSGMTHELREHDPRHAFKVQGSKPVVSDSSTNCMRPSPNSSETTTIRSHEVQTPDDSSQPSTSRVKAGEISLRPMTGTSRANTNELIYFSSSTWQVYQ